jgi:hypothetical protein
MDTSDISGANLAFHIYHYRVNSLGDTDCKEPDESFLFCPMTWEARTLLPSEPGKIRLFEPPSVSAGTNTYIKCLWDVDRTYTHWHTLMDVSNTPFENAVFGPGYRAEIAAIFHRTQRQRYLARLVLQRLRNNVWRKRTACNVDMIDMQPIPDCDAVFVTDTTNKCVYRFHRRDIFSSLLSNICMSDDMLPCPRLPTNPWTNQPLTLVQVISVCQQLVTDYARRGRCPPPLFAAFWAARFDITRFEKENSASLAQHAIATYFKDITDDTVHTVFDTMTSLLVDSGCEFSPAAVRRWLRASPQTAQHVEWLSMVRDYTLYMNLHVQARAHWYTRDHILADVQRLFNRTDLPDPTSQRMRSLRTPAPVAEQYTLGALLGIPVTIEMSDASGGSMDYNLAIQLIQQALFRM